MSELRITVSGETTVNVPSTAKISLDEREADLVNGGPLTVGFSNCDLRIGPVTVQHKSIKEMMQTIAGLKQSLEQIGSAAVTLTKKP